MKFTKKDFKDRGFNLSAEEIADLNELFLKPEEDIKTDFKKQVKKRGNDTRGKMNDYFAIMNIYHLRTQPGVYYPSKIFHKWVSKRIEMKKIKSIIPYKEFAVYLAEVFNNTEKRQIFEMFFEEMFLYGYGIKKAEEHIMLLSEAFGFEEAEALELVKQKKKEIDSMPASKKPDMQNNRLISEIVNKYN